MGKAGRAEVKGQRASVTRNKQTHNHTRERKRGGGDGSEGVKARSNAMNTQAHSREGERG